ncbi:MAG: citryl-CoA lyase, partial [Candidatus Limnocylindria bacterium]
MSGRIRSDLGSSTADTITVRGLDLAADIIGKVSLGDLAFLELKGRLPTPQESAVFNAIAVTLVEHGMTPSAIAARLTYFGAPESLQGAVAAGLLGLGDRFGGSIEGAARALQEGLEGKPKDADLRPAAREIVAGHKAKKQVIPGLGHPIHKPVDPRTPRLFAVAAENGLSGRYLELMELIADEARAA